MCTVDSLRHPCALLNSVGEWLSVLHFSDLTSVFTFYSVLIDVIVRGAYYFLHAS